MGQISKILIYTSIAIILGYAIISIFPNQGVNIIRSKLNQTMPLSGEEPQANSLFGGLRWKGWVLIWLLNLVVALCVYLFAQNKISLS